MNRLICLVAFLISTSVLAANTTQVNTSGLSDEQIAKIKETAAQLQQQSPSIDHKAKQVAEWVDIGTNIGKGLGGAAKELGIAVNEFALTPVGKLTAIVIVWKFIGSAVVHIFGAILFWAMIWSFVLWYARKNMRSVITYYDDKPGKIKSEVTEKMDEGTQVVCTLFFAVGTLVGVVIMFTF